MEEKQIGAVDHFFDKISVAMIKLSDALNVGEKIRIKGKAVDFTQDVTSMQIDRIPVQSAKTGDLISLKIEQKVRAGDAVYKTG